MRPRTVRAPSTRRPVDPSALSDQGRLAGPDRQVGRHPVRISTLREGEVTPLCTCVLRHSGSRARERWKKRCRSTASRRCGAARRTFARSPSPATRCARRAEEPGVDDAHVMVAAKGREMPPLLEVDALGARLPVPAASRRSPSAERWSRCRAWRTAGDTSPSRARTPCVRRRISFTSNRDPATSRLMRNGSGIALLSRSGDQQQLGRSRGPAGRVAGARSPSRVCRGAPSVPATSRIVRCSSASVPIGDRSGR